METALAFSANFLRIIGLTENSLVAIKDVIRTHELIKVSILKTYEGLPTKELAELICSTIGAEYGSRAERAFIEFARFDERNNSRTSMHVMLESGLTEFLREARMATLNSDAVRDFNVAVSNVCNMHKQQEQSVTYSSNAAAFK